jgi:hypothetical protein
MTCPEQNWLLIGIGKDRNSTMTIMHYVLLALFNYTIKKNGKKSITSNMFFLNR